MEELKHVVIDLLNSIYYMMGIVEGCGCKASYDLVFPVIDEAEQMLRGENVITMKSADIALLSDMKKGGVSVEDC